MRQPMYTIAYSKPNKRFVAKIVKVEKTTEYLHFILSKILERADLKFKEPLLERQKRQLSLTLAPEERASRGEIIEESMKHKRLKL